MLYKNRCESCGVTFEHNHRNEKFDGAICSNCAAPVKNPLPATEYRYFHSGARRRTDGRLEFPTKT